MVKINIFNIGTREIKIYLEDEDILEIYPEGEDIIDLYIHGELHYKKIYNTYMYNLVELYYQY